MAPMRKGDGTALTAKGFSEVRKGDGTKLWTEIPASEDLQAHYAARLENLSNGATTSTIADQQNDNDLTGDSLTFETGYQNNEPTFVFDGASSLENGSFAFEQPCTIVFVAESTADNTSQHLFGDSGDTLPIFQFDTGEFNNRVGINAGAGLVAGGADDLVINIWAAVFDGGSSAIRKNGSQIASGDAGTDDFAGFIIGDRGDGFEFNGNLPEMLIYDGVQTTEIDDFLNGVYAVY